MNDRIKDRLAKLTKRLQDSKITAEEIPGLVDRAFDVVELALDAGDDGRVSLGEMAQIWRSLAALRDAVAAARRD